MAQQTTTEADLASYFCAGPQQSGEFSSSEKGNGYGISYTIIPRLFHILKQERRDVLVVIAYSAIVGLFSLVVPLVSQGLVNAVSLGVLTTQLVVLTVIAAVGLLFVGTLSVIETYIVEVLRQRIFVRSAFEIGYRLPRIRKSSLENDYAPELVNRFFDVMTVQKVLGKFLLDGVSAVLTAFVGILLLAVYHPFFLLFDILLILFAAFLVSILSRGALEASIKQSKKKYAMAYWLEEIGRCMTSFKLYSTPEFVNNKVDHIASEYVQYRRKYFKVVLRQLGTFAVFRALALSGILGIGGILVIDKQISIGQLVAAELVVFAMLGAFEKIVMQFEEYYDLLTAIDKISHITDKPLESQARSEVVPEHNAAALQIQEVRFSYNGEGPTLNNISLNIPAGSRISLVGRSGSGKSTLAKIIARLYDYDSGVIALNGYDIRRIELQTYRSMIGMVFTSDEIFNGTIEENILMGRQFSYDETVSALRLAGLYEDVFRLPNGLQTVVESTGKTLSYGMQRRIMFARAVVGRPCVLILDDSFAELEECQRVELLNAIYNQKCWTIIDISHDAEQLKRADTIVVLSEGTVVEQGSPVMLASQNKYFSALFPELSRELQK